MDHSFIENKYTTELMTPEIISFLGYKVYFTLSAIRHAFYECPHVCTYHEPSNALFRHCKRSKDNCPYKSISETRVNNMGTIKDVLTASIAGKIEVFEKDTKHVYVYREGLPYFVVVLYPGPGNKYYFLTARDIFEKEYLKNICNCNRIN